MTTRISTSEHRRSKHHEVKTKRKKEASKDCQSQNCNAVRLTCCKCLLEQTCAWTIALWCTNTGCNGLLTAFSVQMQVTSVRLTQRTSNIKAYRRFKNLHRTPPRSNRRTNNKARRSTRTSSEAHQKMLPSNRGNPTHNKILDQRTKP